MAILPTTQRVGRLMWGRTRTTGDDTNVAGVVEGDFNESTIPTGDEVDEIITLAAAGLVDVIGSTDTAENGDTPWPDELQTLASAAIAYQAAADIETSFFADATLQDPTNRDYYQTRAAQLRAALVVAVDEWRASGETGEPDVEGSYTLEQPGFAQLPASVGNRMVVTGDDPDRRFWQWFGPWGGW